MIAKQDILDLKTKILPAGAEAILDYLATKHQLVEYTQIVLENVPLLIIGRHGMIARIPSGSTVQKVSQPQEIIEQLRVFFQKQETLYLFTNLPELPLPSEVTQVLEEAERRHERKMHLKKSIDDALANKDKEAFMTLTAELHALQAEEDPNRSFKSRISFLG